jgi:phosphopantetheine adenylyltransferase
MKKMKKSRCESMEKEIKLMIAKDIENGNQNKAREFLALLRNEEADKIATDIAKGYIKEGKLELALIAADLIKNEEKQQEVLKEIDKKSRL